MGTKVLLDANILISQHFLKGHLGIVLIVALRRTGSKLVLPEATFFEAKARALDEAEKKLATIKNASGQLAVLLGQRPAAPWPGASAVGTAIDDHFKAIEDVVEREPIDLADVRGALARVVGRIAPARTKEEFRDALLWETALRFARDNKVYLACEDGDFLGPGGKLLPDLENEVRSAGVDLTHFRTLSDLLDALGPEALSIDKAVVGSAVASAVRPIVTEAIADKGVSIEDAIESNLKAFATENPNRLALSFETQFNGVGLSANESPANAVKVTASGSASIDPRTNTVAEIELDKINVDYEGGGHGSHVFLRGMLSTGTPSFYRPFEFRKPLQ